MFYFPLPVFVWFSALYPAYVPSAVFPCCVSSVPVLLPSLMFPHTPHTVFPSLWTPSLSPCFLHSLPSTVFLLLFPHAPHPLGSLVCIFSLVFTNLSEIYYSHPHNLFRFLVKASQIEVRSENFEWSVKKFKENMVRKRGTSHISAVYIDFLSCTLPFLPTFVQSVLSFASSQCRHLRRQTHHDRNTERHTTHCRRLGCYSNIRREIHRASCLVTALLKWSYP